MARPESLDSKIETNIFRRRKSIFNEDQTQKQEKEALQRKICFSMLVTGINGMKKVSLVHLVAEKWLEIFNSEVYLSYGGKKKMLNGLKVKVAWGEAVRSTVLFLNMFLFLGLENKHYTLS